MSSEQQNSSYSLGTILFLIFMVLKLTGNIGWSWWWVTSPLWGSVVLVIVIVLLAALLSHPK